jgi:uncharacterized protein (DUF1810 family)
MREDCIVRPIKRFIDAQDDHGAFDAALAEITAGRKQGHWIWYVFPQISGLGFSPMSDRYAISGRAEAEAYLAHSTLYSRLVAITSAVAKHVRNGTPVGVVMNSSIDAQKLVSFVSSLTLFGAVARDVSARAGDDVYSGFAAMADEILTAAHRQGFPRCRHTEAALVDSR